VLLLVLALVGCSSGEARTTPTTVPPIRPTDGRLGIAVATDDPAALAGIDLAVDDVNRAGGVDGHPVRVVDRARADVVIGTDADIEPVAADEAFLDRLRQVDPSLDAVGLAARTYAAVRKAAKDAKPADI
jgi:hypothetical protein